MNMQPLAAGLPNQKIVFDILLVEYIITPLSLCIYSIIYKAISTSNNYLLTFISKLYIISNFIYKLLVIIYKLIITCKGCNNPYKQGPIAPSTHYKY